MRTVKSLVGAVGVAALICLADLALAGPVTPVTVSDVGVDWSQGEGLSLNIGAFIMPDPSR
jgi:hypothetical protein